MEDRRLYMHKQPNSSDVFYADGSIGVTLVNGTQVIFPHGILHVSSIFLPCIRLILMHRSEAGSTG